MKTFLRPLTLIAFVSAAVFPLGAAEEAAAAAGYVPCKISSRTPATFPLRLLQSGVTHGEARLILEVSTEGKLTDVLLAAYTHREFADEALRVVNEARYTPGFVDGQPVISIVNVTYRFETSGVVVYQRIGLPARETESLNAEFEYQAHGPTTIDQKLSPRRLPGPIYPQAWIDQGRIGSVTVDFYIDESGRTRMPVALGAPDDYLAAAAVAAVKDWLFEPPRYRGRPTLAHAQQVFVFKPEPKPPREPGV